MCEITRYIYVKVVKQTRAAIYLLYLLCQCQDNAFSTAVVERILIRPRWSYLIMV